MKNKDDELILSKKHGVQPTIPLCRYCNKSKNQVLLLGAAGDRLAIALGCADGRMPMNTLMPGDYEPCDDCKSKGVLILEMTNDKQQPTGSFWLVKEAVFDNLGEDASEFARHAKSERFCLVTQDTAAQMGLHEASMNHQHVPMEGAVTGGEATSEIQSPAEGAKG